MGLGLNIGLGGDLLPVLRVGVEDLPGVFVPASPLLASASGGQVFTLPGTNLSGVTGVTVGGAAATSVSSTATSVTFTTPAKAASSTPYAIVTTNPKGVSTLPGIIYMLPTGVQNAWYAAQYNAGAGTWTDLVGSVALAAGGGLTKPTLTASWTNGQPGVAYSGTNELINATQPTLLAQPFSVFVVCDVTATTNYNYIFDSNGGATEVEGRTNSGGNAVLSYAGAALTPPLTISTPSLNEFYYNGNSSAVAQNNGTQNTGAAGSSSLLGITLGARYDGNSTIISALTGHIGLCLIFNGTPAAGDRSIIHGITQALYATA